MLFKIKTLISLLILFVLLGSSWFLYQKCQERILVAHYKGQLEYFLVSLPKNFKPKIELENYDHIEKDFQEARGLLKKIEIYEQGSQSYEKLNQRFLDLWERKNRYKALSSQIASSFLILQKIAKERRAEQSQEMQIYLYLLESMTQGLETQKLLDLVSESHELDPVFAKHILFLMQNFEKY